MEMPRFKSTNILGWIFRIHHFFNFHNAQEEQWISVASFCLDGPALNWYQWIYNNNELTLWPNFFHALRIHFAPSQFDDPNGALFKLTQTTTVWEYQTQFEALSNRVVGLPNNFLLSCFIYGLKPNIKWEVQALHPINLMQIVDFAKL